MSQASPEDVQTVTRVATEYYQSWFAGDGDAPVEPGTETLVLDETPAESLVAITASGRRTRFDPRQEVSVLV